MRSRNFIELCCDFETLSPGCKSKKEAEEFVAEVGAQVYSWSATTSRDNNIIATKGVGRKLEQDCKHFYGISIESFMDFILENGKEIDLRIIFHNFSGFDGHYILPVLGKYGFSVTPKKGCKETDPLRYDRLEHFYGYKRSGFKYHDPLPKEIKYSIEKGKKIYSLSLYLAKNENRKNRSRLTQLLFQDNWLQFGGSIASWGIELSKHYNNPTKYLKKEMDYYRVESFSSLEELETVNDGKILEYQLQDTYILFKAREMLDEHLKPLGWGKEKWKTTTGAMSYANFESTLKKDLYDATKTGGNTTEGFRTANAAIKELLSTNWLTENEGKKYYQLKKYYRGGLSMVNEKFRGRLVSEVRVFDVNSMYPSVMNSNLPCPVGAPVPFEEGDYHLRTITVLKHIENKYYMPFIAPVKPGDKKDISAQYVRNLYKGDILYLAEPEYQLFLKAYYVQEGDIHVKVDASFKTVDFRDIFHSHVNMWYEVKKSAKLEGNIVQTMFAKLQLNSLYGKFGTKMEHAVVDYNPATGEFIESVEIIEPKYFPISIAITSAARCKLINGIGDQADEFVYSDTDSLFVTEKGANKIRELGYIKISEELGDWDNETAIHPGTIVVRRSKQYLMMCSVNGRACKECPKPIKTAFAGINFYKVNSDGEKYIDLISFDNFIYGVIIGDQLMPYRNDGVILYETEKEIIPIWEYKPHPEQIWTTENEITNIYERDKRLLKSVIYSQI